MHHFPAIWPELLDDDANPTRDARAWRIAREEGIPTAGRTAEEVLGAVRERIAAKLPG